MTEKKGTPTPPTKPDGIITTQRNGQTIVAELFFNPNGTETFSDKLLKTILADSLRFSASVLIIRLVLVFLSPDTLTEAYQILL